MNSGVTDQEELAASLRDVIEVRHRHRRECVSEGDLQLRTPGNGDSRHILDGSPEFRVFRVL